MAEIRSIEPAGLLGLAKAQIHLKQWAAAAETLDKLTARGWPPRFGSVESQVQQLRRQVDDGRRP